MRAQMIIRYWDGREKVIRVQDTPWRIMRNTYRANRDAPAHIGEVRWAPEWRKGDVLAVLAAVLIMGGLGAWMACSL